MPRRRSPTTSGRFGQPDDEAALLRTSRIRDLQRDAAARGAQVRQGQRDRRLAGWAAAVDDAVADTQLTAAVQRVTRPVGGLDRRSAPVAASQLLAWVIASATAAPDTPLEVTLTHALHDHAGDPEIAVFELPDDIPPAPATNTAGNPEALRRRVRLATDDLEAQRAPRQPKTQGGSDAP